MSDNIKTIREALEKERKLAYATEFSSCIGCGLGHDEAGQHARDRCTTFDTALSALDQLAPTADIRFDEFTAAAKARGYPMLTDLIEAHDKMKSQPSLDIPEAIKAFEFIKEIGERDWSTRRLNTCEDRVKSMVKWANHGIASLTP